MSETGIVAVASEPGIVPAELVERAQSFARDARAARTRDAYRLGWRTFTTWCAGHGLTALPAAPETVALFLTARAEAGKKVATISLELAAVVAAHRAAGHTSPGGAELVRVTMQGIRRVKGVAPRRVSALSPEQLRAIVAVLPAGLIGLRDRALLVTGFAGGFRRSELVSLDHADLKFTNEGVEVTLRRSKTDQEQEGRKVGLPYGGHKATCPVRALQEWLDASAITSGPVWRPVDRHGRARGARLAGRAVAEILKRSLTRIGLDPSTYAGHSLRSGLVTAAAKAGKSEHAIMKQTGHRSVTMLRRYIRDATLFEDNAAASIGL